MQKSLALSLLLIMAAILPTSAQMKPGWGFHDELVRGLENAHDTIYIQDRRILEKIVNTRKSSYDENVINYKTKAGDSVYILFAVKPINHAENINYKKAYGIDIYSKPKKKVGGITIKWDDAQVAIPESAYANLYEPNSIEAYLSRRKKLLYIYLQGSDGAYSYSVKFVFDKKKYITRLITTNECADGFDFLDATSAGDCE